MKLHDDWGRGRADVLTTEVLSLLGDNALRQVALMLNEFQIGMSSAALIRWAILTPDSDEFTGYLPCDLGDLGRCEAAYTAAPAWLRDRMHPLLVEFRRHVAARSARVSERPEDAVNGAQPPRTEP